MPTFHTFTNFDLLPVQDGMMNFGVVSATEYRTWAAFPSSGNTLKAFAVTEGEFFIQETTSSNLVNLILKPDAQPDARFSPVKFFVYRGLKKSSFLDGSGNVLPANTIGLSDLLTRMWQVRNNLNASAGVNETLERNDLGLDEIGDPDPLPDSYLIDDVFETFVFQRLTPGWTIGEFDTSGNYGFEIIIEGPNYKPKLGDVRVLDHKVTITYQSGQPQFANGEEEDISIKLKREQILSYIDPAAYFGLLFDGKIELHKSIGNQTLKNAPASVYSEIIDKFATKNKIYIDIRNELNNSLNFYGSYGDGSVTNFAQVKFEDTSNTFVDKAYHTSGWPILILNVSEFASSANQFEKATLKLPNGDNNLPALFLSASSFFNDFPNYKEKFKIITNGSTHSNDFEIGIPNNSSTQVVFPFIVKFAYARRYNIDALQSVPATLTRPWKDDYIDNFLSPSDVHITPNPEDPNNQTTVQWNTSNELKYIGWTSLKGVDFIFLNGKAKESIGTTLYGFTGEPLEKNGNTNFYKIHSSLDFNKSNFFAKTIFEYFVSKKLISLGLTTVQSSNIGMVDIPRVKSSFDSYSNIKSVKALENFITISLADSEIISVETQANAFLSGSNFYLISLSHILESDTIDSSPIFYFDLGIQGIIYNELTYSHIIQKINTNIKCFSVNGRNYFSQSYTNALKNNNLIS